MILDLIRGAVYFAILGFMLYRVIRITSWTEANELERMDRHGDYGLPWGIAKSAWIPMTNGVGILLVAGSILSAAFWYVVGALHILLAIVGFTFAFTTNFTAYEADNDIQRLETASKRVKYRRYGAAVVLALAVYWTYCGIRSII